MTDAVPSRCATLLASGEVEAALVPVIEYQRISDLLVVPGVCVGSRSEVRSVMLASQQKSLHEVRSVALDESSRTSATLLKVIFREFVGTEPKWSSFQPDLKQMLRENDAALIIGDPGMTFPREGLTVFDMASLWRHYTGKGFVFAMWMVAATASPKTQALAFASARDEGVARIDEIVSAYKRRLPLSAEEMHRYLTENIVFTIDEEMEAGMRLYFDLAEKHGLIERKRELMVIAGKEEREEATDEHG